MKKLIITLSLCGLSILLNAQDVSVEKSSEFDKWIRKLKDIRAKSKILFRIQKLETDEHFGDCKPVGDGISELRVNYAKGYRIYFKEKDNRIVIL